MGKERPIIFTTESVKAILDGRKTMTRRVMKPQPVRKMGLIEWNDYLAMAKYPEEISREFGRRCPYGQVGDRLWVRETWRCSLGYITHQVYTDYSIVPVYYKADDVCRRIPCKQEYLENHNLPQNWQASLFMPRWASRLTLEITEVRVERLQEITQTDVDREGISPINITNAVPKFRELWDSINGKKYPWLSNPWVWVIKFDNIGGRVK